MKKLLIVQLIFLSATLFAQTQIKPVVQQPQSIPAQMQNAVQQPSAEELEKQKKAKLEKRKQFLQTQIFQETKPCSAKIDETFFEKYKYWLIAGIIAFLATIALIFKPRRKKLLTPYQEAKLRLQTIKKISNSLEVKPYAEEVSQIVRDYIDKVYNIPAPERTTQEFLEIAHQSKYFDESSKQILKEILQLADIAKFAKHSFTENERMQILEKSENFVETDNTHRISNNMEAKQNEL